MKDRFLGKDRLKVSAIGYGCPPFQGKLSDAEETHAIRVLHRAIDIGINFIDSADHNNGNNEEILAKVLKASARRSRAHDQIRQPARPAVGEWPRSRRQAGVCRVGLRSFAQASANRLHRSLLFAPCRSQSAD